MCCYSSDCCGFSIHTQPVNECTRLDPWHARHSNFSIGLVNDLQLCPFLKSTNRGSCLLPTKRETSLLPLCKMKWQLSVCKIQPWTEFCWWQQSQFDSWLSSCDLIWSNNGIQDSTCEWKIRSVLSKGVLSYYAKYSKQNGTKPFLIAFAIAWLPKKSTTLADPTDAFFLNLYVQETSHAELTHDKNYFKQNI